MELSTKEALNTQLKEDFYLIERNFEPTIDNELLQHNDNHVVIIEGEAGIGKSTILPTLLDKLKTSNPSLTSASVNLFDLTRNLSNNSAILVQILAENPTLTDLFLDGFDEIDQQNREKIIEEINECSRIRFWIVTRPHLAPEDKFCCRKYRLQPVDVASLRQAFEFSARKTFGDVEDRLDDVQLQCFVDELMAVVVQLNENHETRFVGLPLLVKLLTHAFREQLHDCHKSKRKLFSFNDMNLVKIFHQFLTKMYYVYCDDTTTSSDRKLISFATFLLQHQLLAVDFLLPEDEFMPLLSDKDKEMLQTLKNSQFSSGIIEAIAVGHAKFIHRSLAEFLAASFFIENLQALAWKLLIERTLFKDENTVLHYLFFEMIAQYCGENITLFPKFQVNYTELMFAAIEAQNLQQLQICIANGADVNMESPTEINPLQRAIQLQNLNLIQLLVENGANVNAMDSQGWTVMKRIFHLPCENSRKILNFLIAHNLDIHVEDHFGWTSLMYAEETKQYDLAAILLENGYYIHTITSYGYDVIEWTIDQGFWEYFERLIVYDTNYMEYLSDDRKAKVNKYFQQKESN